MLHSSLLGTQLLWKNLPLTLLKSREAVCANFRPILNKVDVTEQQWRVLRILHEHGDLRPNQIAEQCGILSPSLTGMLQRMKQSGLVVISPSSKDLRMKNVGLTQFSRELIGKTMPLVDAKYLEMELVLGRQFMNELCFVMHELMSLKKSSIRDVA